MGDGWLGWYFNVNCIVWTLFVSVLFSLPTYFPVTAENMNYASVITVGVIALSLYVHLVPVSSITLTTIFTKALVFLWVHCSFLCQRERYLSTDGVYSARRHYKGPVSYTDGRGRPTESDTTNDQTDEKGTDVTA